MKNDFKFIAASWYAFMIERNANTTRNCFQFVFWQKHDSKSKL